MPFTNVIDIYVYVLTRPTFIVYLFAFSSKCGFIVGREEGGREEGIYTYADNTYVQYIRIFILVLTQDSPNLRC